MVSLQATLVALTLTAAPEPETALYDFYADWCAPCRAMAPTMNALEQRGYPIKRVNVDQNPTLAAQFRANDLPCFVMVVDGREVSRMIGMVSFEQLQSMCRMASPAKTADRSAEPASPSLRQGQVIPRQATATPTAPEMPTARQHGEAVTDTSAMVAASVRLRIEDPNGYSSGSGTIIYADSDEALILTCWHIFRDSRGKGRIAIDLFGQNPARQVAGQLVSYDTDADVALVKIRSPGPVTAARVAPAGYQLRRDAPVVTVGCSHGNDPTARHTRVISVDRFLGPPNLQVDGQSVEGRSGGGLFSADGLVLGVCNAADPEDDAAIYAALGAVHAELDAADLSHVYQPARNAADPRAFAARDRSLSGTLQPPPVMPEYMSAQGSAGATQGVRPLSSMRQPRIGANYDRRPCGVGPTVVWGRGNGFRPGSLR